MSSPHLLKRTRPGRRAKVCAITLAIGALQLVGACAAPVQAAAPTPLTLGFNDYDLSRYSGFLNSPVNEPALAAGLANGHRAGAQQWRVELLWNRIAGSTAPQPATAAADPAWAGYNWADTDRQIRAIAAAGMTAIVWPIAAPVWAEGAGRPAVSATAPTGTWKPSPEAYGIFAQALATRYSGTYPDPARPGQALPRIKDFQAWNEPNLSTYLTPQWEHVDSQWKASSPALFRSLVNAYSAAIKKIQPSALVITGGTAPFGDLHPGDPRIPPVAFWRELACVKKRGTRMVARKGCPKLKVDGWAHHTYPIGPPWRTARNADDVVVPDMPKLTKLIAAAAKVGTIPKKAAKDIWMTEMSWESAPDPAGLDLQTQASYMQGAFYLLWKAGVRHIFWYGSRDMAQGSNWNLTFQSGVFLRGADPTQDTPKPSFTSFQFPFAAFRDRGVAKLWARPPGAGPVIVQAQTSPGTWKTAATLRSIGGGIVTGNLRVGPDVTLRAVQGGANSITWTTS